MYIYIYNNVYRCEEVAEAVLYREAEELAEALAVAGFSVRLSVPLRPHTSAFQLEGAGPATPLGRRQQTRRQIVRILFRSYISL